MPESLNSKIKRAESTAETFERKGKREWAYAKNDVDGNAGSHYKKAREAFDRAKKCRESAENLKNQR